MRGDRATSNSVRDGGATKSQELPGFGEQLEWLMSEKLALSAVQEGRCDSLAIQVDTLRARHATRVQPLEAEVTKLRAAFDDVQRRTASAEAEVMQTKQKLQRARREIVRLRQIAADAQRTADELRHAETRRERAAVTAMRRECDARLDAQRLKHRQELYIREKMLRG